MTGARLPAYAPELNTVERLGEHEEQPGHSRLLQLIEPAGRRHIMKNRLKRIQYRPALIDGFLAQTGLSIEPEPP
jgi:hypothetical protein